MGTVVRSIRRAAAATVAGLEGYSVATAREAQGRMGLLAPVIRPIQSGAHIEGERKAHRVLSTVLTMILLTSVTPVHAQTASADAVIATSSGAVRGRANVGYTEWLGIPYAAPPVGALRWRKPQPAAHWAGVRDATDPGNACVQGTGWEPGYEQPTLTEDCLFANVYRPHDAGDSGLLPVFVWIHGGGLRGGAGYDVDPRKFVTRAKVVFVTFNYRLGAMGFLALPSLASEDVDAVGNYGMLDQQAALRWVQTNFNDSAAIRGK